MADSDFLYKIGRRFYMPWGDGKKMIFVVIDRMHTERGNMYWLQNRVRPKFTQLFWEDYLAEGRRPDALEMFDKRWDRSLKGGLQPPPGRATESPSSQHQGHEEATPVSKYQAGDVVAYRLEDIPNPGLVKARIVKPTRMFVTGQLYRIEYLEPIRPSRVGTKPPKPGKTAEVVEKLLVPLAEV